MAVFVVATLVVLVVAAAVMGIVVVGMEGRFRDRMPELSRRLERAGRHLNGEAEPRQLTKLFH